MRFSLTSPSGGPSPPPPPSMRDLPELGRPGSTRRSEPRGGKALAAVATVAGLLGLAVWQVGLGKVLKAGNVFAPAGIEVITYAVKPANLPVVVSERGSLESSKNEDAYCQVEGQTTIIMIVPEGTKVAKGQLVCELDSSALKDSLTNQVITTKGADAAYQNARLTREVAEIAVKEYEEGVYKQNRETCMIDIKLAESTLKSAEDRLDWSDRMLTKGYVSVGQNLSDRLNLQKAKFSLEQAQTKMTVLEKFTRDKTIKELQADVEKAKSDEKAKEQTWDLEKTKEAKLDRQIKNCKIIAPNDGLVVYANDPNRFGGSAQPQIEEGATVRERQKIFSLPDISKMRVNTKVHESMVDRIKPGLRARIKVDAFAEETLPGVVEDVAPLPDPSSFFSSDVKVYTTHVVIEKGLPGLRPGMTSQVEILVVDLPDVLSVPVMAVLQYKNKDHVAVKTADGFEWRDVVLGLSNDRLVEVKSGLKSGDRVALSPIVLMSEDEKNKAFGSSQDPTTKDWAAAKKVGVIPGAPAAGADGKPAAKPKGLVLPPALKAKVDAIPKEERAKLRTATPEEREAFYKKSGLTEDEVKQYIQFQMQRMMQRKAAGEGGGFGGPGGEGGGGGFGGGQGGPRQ